MKDFLSLILSQKKKMNQKYSVLDVVKQDLCTGCGVCVSESKSTLKMGWDKYGFLVPQKIDAFINYESIKVCPFNPYPDEEVCDEDKLAVTFLKDASNYGPHIGRFENTYVGFANEYRETSSSGGIATYIFKQLLEDKIVDHLFIVKEVEGSYKYQFFSDVNDIIKISKTRYIPVTLEELFNIINQVEGKIGVSGVACFIKAIRLKQHYNPQLKEKIPFLVGIICGGLKSRFFTDFLAKKAGIISNYSNQEYRIKDVKSTSSNYSFGAYDSENEFHQMKMSTVGDMWGTGLFKSNACDFCSDVLTELADISLGDAWLDEYKLDGLGNSIVISRSKKADYIIQEGIYKRELNLQILDESLIIKSQKSSFIHRQDALKFRVDVFSRKRKLIPFVRKRIFKEIDLITKIIQILRMKTRKKSLIIWKNYQSSILFDEKMSNHLFTLKMMTKVSHKVRALKAKFRI
ncbi:Coenzyme F420-reducing hydrogenase, beta subunit [Flavobacterium saccharophilum]|uniref:Coenzyme F420-reducing hydrogenase, beta subunit n=2 Tax=Flavobacterium saccharophilum TaxID=29534 RepID=A0A1M7GUR1_9FLAO|nr:Coenzyme F420-reducing hydrogenase, beta subunit [Flavobacterium saccharophilum]